jgi:hypothetical protein
MLKWATVTISLTSSGGWLGKVSDTDGEDAEPAEDAERAETAETAESMETAEIGSPSEPPARKRRRVNERDIVALLDANE